MTLIELLAVIVIIGILAALLLPTLSRAYRQAQVLACPIAYVAADGFVYLTDPTGQRQLKVCGIKASNSQVSWSPDGRRISFIGPSSAVVVNPVTERCLVLTNFGNSHWWISSGTIEGIRWYQAGNHHELWRVEIDAGREYLWKQLRAEGLPYGQIRAKYEPYLDDGYLVCEPDWTWTPTADVVVRGLDWELKRVIWRDADNNTQDWGARVDLAGEYIAWTRNKWGGASIDEWYVALKGLSDDPDVPPTKLGLRYQSAAFCDWTPHGDLLVSLKEKGKLQLAIMSTDGAVISVLPAPRGLFSTMSDASWRRYEHW